MPVLKGFYYFVLIASSLQGNCIVWASGSLAESKVRKKLQTEKPGKIKCFPAKMVISCSADNTNSPTPGAIAPRRK